MGAITCAPERDYAYIGYIRMHRMDALDPKAPEYVLLRARDDGIAPALLEIRDELKGYIEDVLATPFKEGRMLKRFHFNQYCELRAVEILDDEYNVVKTVRQGEDWRPFIGEEKEAET
jgi:hypothetical protein